jgi:lipooligosaccharide transport system permease protein
MAAVTSPVSPAPWDGSGRAVGRSRPGPLRVVEREARIYRRLWHGSVFTYFVGPALYLAAMGLGLGGLIEDNGGFSGDITYLQFVAPGLLAATVMQSAAADSLWPIMGGLKWMRSFHAMAATPLTPGQIVTGHLTWGAMRVALSATIFLIVAGVLGALASPWAPLAVVAAVLTGLAFAAPISAFSATQETDSRFPLVMRFVILPLFLFSGTFFPLTDLPDWLQTLAWISPLWHGVELCRSATTGQIVSLAALVGHVAVLVAYAGVGLWCAARAFRTRLAA